MKKVIYIYTTQELAVTQEPQITLRSLLKSTYMHVNVIAGWISRFHAEVHVPQWFHSEKTVLSRNCLNYWNIFVFKDFLVKVTL